MTVSRLVLTLLMGTLLLAFRADKPRKIIFFGDSITQAGVRPGGYITRLKEALEKQGVKEQYQLIGAGIGGNKIYDLYLRLEDDVLSQQPDVVVVYVGVNDVWHKSSFGTGTDPDKFERFYTAIVTKLQKAGAKVVLCTPAAIGERTDFTNQQDGDLNRYAQIIRDLGARYDCPLIDLRKEFLAYNLKNNKDNRESGVLTTDRVHLNEVGNQLVADLMMKVVLK